MPYASKKQRKWMWANRPDVAAEWEEKYETPKDLPEYSKGSLLDRLKKK